MGNFHERLMRAEARITRLFAQPYPAVLYIGNECRQVNVIFETPDAPVSVPGGGEISNHAPAFSAMTADIVGLSRHDEVLVNNIRYRVTKSISRLLNKRRHFLMPMGLAVLHHFHTARQICPSKI